VYVDGDFGYMDGAPITLAVLDGTTGEATRWQPRVNGVVNAFAFAGRYLYVGGYFTSVDGQSKRGLAVFDVEAEKVLDRNFGVVGGVQSLAVSGSTVYVGGYFSSIGGQSRSHLAAIDTATQQVTAWNPGADDVVEALATAGNTVYAGGNFLTAGGQSRRGIAALDATTGQATSWDPGIDRIFDEYYVHALAVSGNTVYAGGGFRVIGGQNRNYLAALDATTGRPTGWNPDLTASVLTLAVADSVIYAGGRFLAVGNEPAARFATIGRTASNVNYVSGIVFEDRNGNCTRDGGEPAVAGAVVVAQPGAWFTSTDSLGNYSLALDTGSYTISQIIPDVKHTFTRQVCPANPEGYTVRFTGSEETVSAVNFANQVDRWPKLSVSVASNRRRRCFTSSTTVHYCNVGTAAADGVKIYVKLPPYVVPVSASVPYSLDKDNALVFEVGALAADACGSIQLTDSVVCNNPNIRGLTQCTKAWITPTNTRIPGPEWDGSDIILRARCGTNSQIRLALHNAGTGNMADSAAYRILLDAGLALQSKNKLAAGDSLILRVPANGRTVRLEADQRPGHPTKQSTNVTLEACGTNAQGRVSLGFVAQLPCDDAEPEVAEECLPITDSYDPNDKLVRPTGTTPEHYTPTGAALSYTVRFQNTGNDYAYQVVVVDTLAAALDLSTLQMGAVSHPYRFNVSGKGRPVLTWTFDDINLPDSTRDQAGSNGFIQFSIRPLAGLPEKTRVENYADIFFDYNPPIRTNTVFNRIYDVPPVVAAADRLEAAAVVATPVITGFTPTSGTAGTVVTLTGMHFDPVPAGNRVTFNNIAATVTAATATTLSVTVPPGEVAGRIGVTTADGAALSATDFSLVIPPPTAVTPGLPAGAVRIHPNPAPGRFVVEFTQPAIGITEIVTLDARGRRVHTLPLAGKPATRAEIDLTGHPAGMYLVLIRTERGITTRKVTLRP
jgi:hypothetical protein